MSYFLGLGTHTCLASHGRQPLISSPSFLAAGAGNDDEELDTDSDDDESDDEDGAAEIDLEELENKRPTKKAKRS
jgi:hypothetical protein